MADHDTEKPAPSGWRMKDDARTLDMVALKGLAHPLRIAMLDALSVYGPHTASGLAERFGESSGATSYHLRQLEKHGFVREVEGRGTGRERWWERVPGGISLPDSRDARRSDAATRAAGDLISAEWERGRQALLADFLQHGDDRLPEEFLDLAIVSTANLRLTADELRELHDRLGDLLSEVVDEFRGRAAEGSRPVQVQLNLFPVVDATPTPTAGS